MSHLKGGGEEYVGGGPSYVSPQSKRVFIGVHVNLCDYWPATRSQFTNLVSRNVMSEKLNSRRGGCRKNVQGAETHRLFLLQTCTCLLYFEIISCIQW